MRYLIFPTLLGLALLGCTNDDASTAQGSPDAATTANDDGGQSGGNAGTGNGGQEAGVGSGTGDAGNVIADSGISADGGNPTNDGSVATSDGGGGSDCGVGQICFTIDGDAIAAPGGGYTINEVGLGDYVFVKYEMGLVQLSIDVFSLDPGTYDASEAREAGKARVYYFDGMGGEFMSSSGTVTITDIGNGTVTGTFSATLEEFDAGSQTFTGSGPTLEVENGTFVEILIPSI